MLYKSMLISHNTEHYDDVITWKHFPRYWPFVWGIHSSPVNSPHKGQRRGALMFSLTCAWINGRVNNREAGDLRRHLAHYDVAVTCKTMFNGRFIDIYHSNHWNSRSHIIINPFDAEIFRDIYDNTVSADDLSLWFTRPIATMLSIV